MIAGERADDIDIVMKELKRIFTQNNDETTFKIKINDWVHKRILVAEPEHLRGISRVNPNVLITLDQANEIISIVGKEPHVNVAKLQVDELLSNKLTIKHVEVKLNAIECLAIQYNQGAIRKQLEQKHKVGIEFGGGDIVREKRFVINGIDIITIDDNISKKNPEYIVLSVDRNLNPLGNVFNNHLYEKLHIENKQKSFLDTGEMVTIDSSWLSRPTERSIENQKEQNKDIPTSKEKPKFILANLGTHGEGITGVLMTLAKICTHAALPGTIKEITYSANYIDAIFQTIWQFDRSCKNTANDQGNRLKTITIFDKSEIIYKLRTQMILKLYPLNINHKWSWEESTNQMRPFSDNFKIESAYQLYPRDEFKYDDQRVVNFKTNTQKNITTHTMRGIERVSSTSLTFKIIERVPSTPVMNPIIKSSENSSLGKSTITTPIAYKPFNTTMVSPVDLKPIILKGNNSLDGPNTKKLVRDFIRDSKELELSQLAFISEETNKFLVEPQPVKIRGRSNDIEKALERLKIDLYQIIQTCQVEIQSRMSSSDKIVLLLMAAVSNVSCKLSDSGEMSVHGLKDPVSIFIRESFPIITRAIVEPHWWVKNDTASNLCITQALPEHAANIKEMFLHTLPKANIIKIEMIQNKWLYEKYQMQKFLIEKKLGRSENVELMLFHGTSKTMPREIYHGQDGFDPKFAREGLWGTGSYFASNASYSHDYCYEILDNHGKPTGEYQMFFANVLVGDYIELQQDRSLRMAPVCYSKLLFNFFS